MTDATDDEREDDATSDATDDTTGDAHDGRRDDRRESRTGGGPEPGTVYLVGSGPGDPSLLTVRARRLLDEASVVLHDKLPGPEILESIPPERREDVGKRAGGERTSQQYTNERLVELARAGESVVRLKGGDPFVFGRGGEEAEHLADAGVPFEVVPGVSSAVAAPGVAGIPVTHREYASSVSVVTGHEDPTKPDSTVNWEALAATGGTIVVLMGVGKLPEYTAALRDAGMAGDTPVALIERATWPDTRVATGTLDSAVRVRDAAGVEPPAVTVIGEVAASRERVVEFLRGRGGRDATAGGFGAAETASDADGGGVTDE